MDTILKRVDLMLTDGAFSFFNLLSMSRVVSCNSIQYGESDVRASDEYPKEDKAAKLSAV